MKRWELLADLVKRFGWTSGVEVGVREGGNLFRLLDLCPQLSMVGVDPWTHQPEMAGVGVSYCWRGSPSATRDHLNAQYKEVARRADDEYPHRCRIIRGYSVEVAKAFQDGTFDFVFIDAQHDYDSVKADIAAWRPKVTDSVLGHDWQLEGVRKAAREVPDVHIDVMDDQVWGFWV